MLHEGIVPFFTPRRTCAPASVGGRGQARSDYRNSAKRQPLQKPSPHVMPPRKRKATDDDDDSATAHVQSSQSLAAAASPLSPEETEKLANELCRYGACT